MNRLAGFLFYLVYYVVAPATKVTAHRILSHPVEYHRTMKLLESPLYEKMADTAFFVDEIDKEFQHLHEKGSDVDGAADAVDALEHRSNRLHPVLREALTIVPTATPSVEEVDTFRAALRAVKRILLKLETISSAIVHKAGGSPASELLSTSSLLGHLQQAITHVEVEKELKEIGSNSSRLVPDLSRKMAFLQRKWQKAHRALNQCAKSHYRRIIQALYSIARAQDAGDERRMAALARFAEKGVSKKLQASWNSVRKDLLDASKELEEITHNQIAFRFKQSDKILLHHFTLAEALALAYQLHEMLPRLNEAHGKLHALQKKIRILSARAAHHDAASMRLMQENDATRLKLNKLKSDLLSMRKALRHKSAAIMGIMPASELNNLQLDFMKPLQRFAALEKEATVEGSRSRFKRELEELKTLLKEIHFTAAQLGQTRARPAG